MLFRLLGWSSYGEAANSYLAGTVFDVDVTSALSLTRFFGTSDDGIGAPQFPTSLLGFNTGGLGAVCPSSGCVIGLLVDASATEDVFSVRVSSFGAFVDRQFCVGCAAQGSETPPIGVRFSVISSAPPACSNSLDDDGDGKIDSADFGCTSASDTSEKDAAYVCDNGLDDDGDGAIDYPTDPGCAHARGKKENPHCNDGLDNDGDNQIDYPLDSYCTSASASNEAPPPPSPGGCGIGPELAALVPLLAALRRRRRARSA